MPEDFDLWGIDKAALVDRVILGATLSEDKTALILQLDHSEEAVFQTEGDCCSSTWIEHLTVPGDIRYGGRFMGFTSGSPVPTEDQHEHGNGDDYYESLAYYGLAIRTTRGEIIVDYRNSSNGYYGGSIHGPTIRKCPRPSPFGDWNA